MTDEVRVKAEKRKPITKEQYRIAIISARGLLATAGRALGVTGPAVRKACDKWPELWDVVNEEREKIKDIGEFALMRAVENGQLGAIIFFLKTVAKDRGYVERQELTGKDGEPLSLPLGLDLSKLSTEDLQHLERIIAAATRTADDSSGAGTP